MSERVAKNIAERTLNKLSFPGCDMIDMRPQ